MELDADGICKIIKECKKAGVATLQLGELSVNFEDKKPDVVEPSPWPQMDPVMIQNQRDINSLALDPEKERQKVMTTEQQNQVMEQFHDAQRMVNDPVGFEADIIADYMEMNRQEGTDGA